MNLKKFLLLVVLALPSVIAYADSIGIEGVPVHLGDSVQEVQKTMNTTIEPEAMSTAYPSEPQKTMIRLKTKGIWVFFNKQQKVETIRLDAPFAGNIGGVQIGTFHDALVKKLGKPGFTLSSNIGLQDRIFPVIYFLDNQTEARFDFDQDEQVERILIFKSSSR